MLRTSNEAESMSAQPAPLFAWDVDRYHRAIETGVFTNDDHIELVEGELLPVPPIGPSHADIVDEISTRLTLTLADEYRIRTQNPLTLPPDSEPQPDIVVAQAGRYRTAHPGPADTLVVVEVSDTTRNRDENAKLPLYARNRIPEFWLFDVSAGVIHVYSRPEGEIYAEHDMVPFAQGAVRSPTLNRVITFELRVDM